MILGVEIRGCVAMWFRFELDTPSVGVPDICLHLLKVAVGRIYELQNII